MACSRGFPSHPPNGGPLAPPPPTQDNQKHVWHPWVQYGSPTFQPPNAPIPPDAITQQAPWPYGGTSGMGNEVQDLMTKNPQAPDESFPNIPDLKRPDNVDIGPPVPLSVKNVSDPFWWKGGGAPHYEGQMPPVPGASKWATFHDGQAGGGTGIPGGYTREDENDIPGEPNAWRRMGFFETPPDAWPGAGQTQLPPLDPLNSGSGQGNSGQSPLSTPNTPTVWTDPNNTPIGNAEPGVAHFSPPGGQSFDTPNPTDSGTPLQPGEIGPPLFDNGQGGTSQNPPSDWNNSPDPHANQPTPTNPYSGETQPLTTPNANQQSTPVQPQSDVQQQSQAGQASDTTYSGDEGSQLPGVNPPQSYDNRETIPLSEFSNKLTSYNNDPNADPSTSPYSKYNILLPDGSVSDPWTAVNQGKVDPYFNLPSPQQQEEYGPKQQTQYYSAYESTPSTPTPSGEAAQYDPQSGVYFDPVTGQQIQPLYYSPNKSGSGGDGIFPGGSLIK